MTALRPLQAAVRRSCGYLIDCCGMKDLHDYVRSDATKFRDYLFAKGLEWGLCGKDIWDCEGRYKLGPE